MIVYGPLAIIFLLFLIGPLRAHTLRRLERQAPGSLAFTIANRRQFTDPLSLIGVGTPMGAHAASLTSGPAVTADEFGIAIWDNTPFAMVGSIYWDRVAIVEVTDLQTPFRRWTSTAIILAVSVDGATISLPLLSPNGTSRIFASRRESAFLAARLDSLRTAAVPA